ncbi:T9SS type A sorting domain-containing protein [Coprobacter tertius]|uniref:T9SS type A sorting domain-containing protein n=1 Tax=Coprobacter tertius TaxID=2944915 RepID=A0ABT1MHY4_9BACT|nr:T9SS type A sorting domain-containing protein [Coprobacter tertius]MCP9611649.1 T9SS type A sorting domain-containing protein [Coprobacter tertius]
MRKIYFIKKVWVNIIAVLVLLALPGLSWAQYTVTLTLADESGNPITNQMMYLYEEITGEGIGQAAANAQGKCVFDNIPAGEYSSTLNYYPGNGMGYMPIEKKFTVSGNTEVSYSYAEHKKLRFEVKGIDGNTADGGNITLLNKKGRMVNADLVNGTGTIICLPGSYNYSVRINTAAIPETGEVTVTENATKNITFDGYKPVKFDPGFGAEKPFNAMAGIYDQLGKQLNQVYIYNSESVMYFPEGTFDYRIMSMESEGKQYFPLKGSFTVSGGETKVNLDYSSFIEADFTVQLPEGWQCSNMAFTDAEGTKGRPSLHTPFTVYYIPQGTYTWELAPLTDVNYNNFPSPDSRNIDISSTQKSFFWEVKSDDYSNVTLKVEGIIDEILQGGSFEIDVTSDDNAYEYSTYFEAGETKSVNLLKGKDYTVKTEFYDKDENTSYTLNMTKFTVTESPQTVVISYADYVPVHYTVKNQSGNFIFAGILISQKGISVGTLGGEENSVLNGTFYCLPGEYEFIVASMQSGYSPLKITKTISGNENLDFVLSEGNNYLVNIYVEGREATEDHTGYYDLEGATVRLGNQTLISDAGGNTIFLNIPPANGITLEVSKEGYKTITQTVDIPNENSAGNVAYFEITLDRILSSLEENTAPDFTVYPTVTDGTITVTSSESHSGVWQASIVSLTGGVQKTDVLTDGENTIDVSALQPGMYILRITDGNTVVIKKIIKR